MAKQSSIQKIVSIYISRKCKKSMHAYPENPQPCYELVERVVRWRHQDEIIVRIRFYGHNKNDVLQVYSKHFTLPCNFFIDVPVHLVRYVK